MAWELVGTGSRDDLNDVVFYEEQQVEEGQRAKLVCECNTRVPQGTIDSMQNYLAGINVTELEVVGSGSTFEISWRKGFPWAAIIIAAIILIALAVIAIVLWNFFKEIPDDIKPIISTALIIAGCAMAAGLAYFLFRRKY